MPLDGKPRTRFTRWLLVLLLAAAAARLPLCWDAGTVRNDGAEYLAIARALRTTGRYATDLKYHFWTDDPVEHAAWADRPPLYPAFAALCAALPSGLDPTAAARLGNVLLACLALALAAGWLRRLYGERTALLAAGYLFLLPHTVYWTAQPMTESLSLALSLGALWLWPAEHTAGVGRRAAAAGVLAGLVYLCRPTGSLLLAAFLLDRLLARPEGGAAARLAPAGVAAAGFLLVAAPYHLLLWSLHGSPFYSSLGYTFAVRTYYAVTYYGFEAPRPGALEFLREHAGAIPGLVLRQAGHHAQALLFPLAALLPLARWRRTGDGAGPRRAGLLLALLSVLLHTVVWSAWGSSRYFLLPLLVLIAALLAMGERAPASVRGTCLALTAAGLCLALGRLYAAEARPDRGLPFLPAARRAAAEVRGAALVATDRPALLNLLLETPAVMLPRTDDPARLERFLRRFRPDTLVLFVSEPERASAAAMASAWRAGRLPPGWRLDRDGGDVLIARPEPAGARSRPAFR